MISGLSIPETLLEISVCCQWKALIGSSTKLEVDAEILTLSWDLLHQLQEGVLVSLVDCRAYCIHQSRYFEQGQIIVIESRLVTLYALNSVTFQKSLGEEVWSQQTPPPFSLPF